MTQQEVAAGGFGRMDGYGHGNGYCNGHKAVVREGAALVEREVFLPLQDSQVVISDEPANATRAIPLASPPGSRGLTLSIVIPTWNEAANIATVLQHLGKVREVVLVDGYSEDGTVDIALRTRPDVKVVRRKPRGKGDALRAGFAASTGDVIVIMDADGSMDPGEVDVFLSVIALGFDLVKGSRLACGGGSHDLTRVRLAGNAALCVLANGLFGTRWTDLCYGYLAFRRECLPRLALTADGFEIEAQILGHAARSGLRIAEIPSIEMPRLEGESHLNATRDGTRILKAMLAARFAPRPRRAAIALRPDTLATGLTATPRR